MGARQKGDRDEQPDTAREGVPTRFPETTPHSGTSGDMTGWLLNAVTKNTEMVGKLEGTLFGMQAQLTKIEQKVGDIEKEISGHGKWMHTLKAFAAVVVFISGWIVANALWPWMKQKLGIP